MDVVNIINSRLQNQRETGEWIETGLKRLGIRFGTTDNSKAHGEITIVHGMNYAMRGRKGAVLWLDRCWYGNTQEWVSLGWKTSETTRRFITGDSQRLKGHILGYVVEYEPERSKSTIIALDDYPQTVKHSGLYWDEYRAHPARHQYPDTLSQAMNRHGAAICGTGTCAAQAKLKGLHVTCLDKDNIVHTTKPRYEWAADLAWTQFHREEIRDGWPLKSLIEALQIDSVTAA